MGINADNDVDVVSPAALAGDSVVRLAVRLKGQSTILKAPPSVIAESVTEGEHPMDVVYSLQYTHAIKVSGNHCTPLCTDPCQGEDHVEVVLTKRKKNALKGKTVAIASLNLQELVRSTSRVILRSLRALIRVVFLS